jgi:RNA polymerase sigma factor (sigma-70 family)
MSTATLNEVLRRLARGMDAEMLGQESDRQLVERALAQRDAAALQAIVHRHGAMVYRVCWRVLQHTQDAEDAFQATFLVLAQKLRTVRKHASLASWLHGVAHRVSVRARQQANARRRREARTSLSDTMSPDDVTWKELRSALDGTLSQLPDKWRLPLVLCYLEGRTQEEAAKRLAWSKSTLRSRLEEARDALARRLTKCGITMPAALSAVLLSDCVTSAAPPPGLVARVVEAAADVAVGKTLATAASAAVAALAEGAIKAMFMTKLKTVSVVLVAAVALAAIGIGTASFPALQARPTAQPDPVVEPKSAQQPAAKDDPAADRDRSDPLPEGAALRFGTSRYRQGTYINRMTVSSDGKLAVVTTWDHFQGGVRAFDLTNGRVAYTLGEAQWAYAIALSADGKTFVTKVTDRRTTPKLVISLFEAATGKELRKVEFPETDDATMTQWVTFTPDGKFIALTKGNAHGVVLVDLEKGTVARTFPHDAVVYTAAISPDGTRMAAGGEDGGKGKYFTRLWEVASGKELHRLEHGEGGLRTIAFSPDGKTVAGGGDYGWARVWDVESGKELKKFPKAAGYRMVGSVAFAPDGQTLAVASVWSTADAIRLYNLTTGDERLRIDRPANCLHFSSDGKVLTGATSGTIHQWDTTTGKPLTPRMAAESAVEQVLVTRDARRIVTRHLGDDARLWDATTGENLKVLKGTSQCAIALSPDSRYLVWPIRDEKIKFKDPRYPDATFNGSRLRLYDTTTDKFIERFEPFAGYQEEAHELFFTPDGRTLLTTDHRDGTVRVWDFATGKEQRKFRVSCMDEAGIDYYVKKAILSPDGKSLAVSYEAAHGVIMPSVVRLWDVATGTKKHDLPGDYQSSINVAFSPDSRLAVICCQPLFERDVKHQIYVWDLATGERSAPLPDGLPTEAVAMAFADDGRTLATATPDGFVQVWEVATWTIRAKYRGHRDRVTSLTFASDGRLFTGGLDTTVLAWDLRPPKAAGPIDAAWERLTKPDSAAAFKAQGHLLAAPAEAIKLIAGKVKPAEPPDPKRLAALFADLDSPTFATRDQASKGLAEIGRPALTALREIAETTKSAEVRKRATDLIEQIDIDGPTLSAKELREVRAVEVLAWIGTAEAKELLAVLAKGEGSDRLTSAADAALKRMKVRDAGK